MERRRVFIIGGGPSLKGFNFENLRDEDTIAVNESAFDVPNPTYCITADSKTFKKLQEGYFKGVDTSWVVVSNAEHCTMKFRDGQFKNIKTGYVYNPFTPNILIRNAGVEGIGFSFKDFKTGYNSGFCGFQLAVLLGYDEIYLLGFDLNPNEGYYHDKYGGNVTNKNTADKFFNNFVLAFKIMKETRSNIKVFSCSSTSRLNKHIPHIPIKDIFGKVTSKIIGPKSELKLELVPIEEKRAIKILFKYATRQRPEWFKKTLTKYYDMMSKKCLFEFLITIDEDDETMNNKRMIQWITRHFNLILRIGNHKTKIEAINADMDAVIGWDICVVVSDDMIPVEKNFDVLIVKKMRHHFPDMDGVLHFNDGLDSANFSVDRTILLSILGKKFYDRFDYIYHPDYKSFYCDTEFTDVARKMKKVQFIPTVIIKHEWSGGPNSEDALYRRNTKLGLLDKVVYRRRKRKGFPK